MGPQSRYNVEKMLEKAHTKEEKLIAEILIPSLYYTHEDSKGVITYVYDTEEMTRQFENKIKELEIINEQNI